MQIPSLPFKILALGPFRPLEERVWNQDPLSVDQTNIDAVFQSLNPSLEIPLSLEGGRSLDLTLPFKQLKDFHPDRILENTPYLKSLWDAKKSVEEGKDKGLAEEEIVQRLLTWPDFPREILVKPQKSSPSPSRAVENILDMVSLPQGTSRSSSEPHSALEAIDIFLQGTLKSILADENFRNLESIWQGLKILLRPESSKGCLSVQIVPASLETLVKTLSNLMGRLIQDLPSLLLVDFPFDPSPRNLEWIEKISGIAETLLVPIILPITPRFFYLNTWADLPKIPFLPHHLQEPAFTQWRHFRKTPSSRWVALTCNRFLARYPYGPNNETRLLRLEETDRLWVSPVWAMGSLIGQSFLKTGWPTRFTDWHSIQLEDLPLHPAEGARLLCTETAFSEDRISQFIRIGITPLVSSPNQDFAFIPAEASVSGGSLSYQLFLSRILNFLFWCKDHFPPDLEASEIQKSLQETFPLFWEKTGHPSPLNLHISATRTQMDKPPIVRISFQPPREVLPSGDPVELDFQWHSG